jgi:hypothetical protein
VLFLGLGLRLRPVFAHAIYCNEKYPKELE